VLDGPEQREGDGRGGRVAARERWAVEVVGRVEVERWWGNGGMRGRGIKYVEEGASSIYRSRNRRAGDPGQLDAAAGWSRRQADGRAGKAGGQAGGRVMVAPSEVQESIEALLLGGAVIRDAEAVWQSAMAARVERAW
jgi:hypothetical protein